MDDEEMMEPWEREALVEELQEKDRQARKEAEDESEACYKACRKYELEQKQNILREEAKQRQEAERRQKVERQTALRLRDEILMNLRDRPTGWIDYIKKRQADLNANIEVPVTDKAVWDHQGPKKKSNDETVVEMPPLHYAIWHAAYDTIEDMIDLGASLDHRNAGFNSVDIAVRCGQEAVASDLVQSGGKVTSLTVALAVEHERREFLETVLKSQPDLVSAEYNGCPMVCWAARLGKTDIALRLLDLGADMNSKYDGLNLNLLASNAGFKQTAAELRSRINAGRAFSQLSL